MVAYAALRELIPVFPVYALLFTDAGLSTGQVSSLFIIWSATHVLLEVPSGAWADTVPRRRLLVLGAALYTGCFALWTAVPTYAAFAGGFVLWGLSGSLVSGTYEAYVYDHLHARAATASYRRVIAAGETSALVLNLVATAAAAPIVAVWGLVGAGWASVLVCVAATALALTLPPDAPRSHLEPEEEDEDEPGIGYLAMLRAGLAESLHPRVARAVLLAALVPAFLAFDEYFGLLAVDVGASLTWVPLLVALTVAAQALGAALAPRLPMHRLGPVLVVAGLLVAAGAAAARPLGFVAVAVGYGALQAAIVVAETDLQHRIEGPARATVTSVSGLLSDFGAIGLYAFVALGSAAAIDGDPDRDPVDRRRGRRPRRREGLPGDVAETDRLPRPQLSALPQVVEGDDPDDRVAARRRVVGQEDQGLPVGWHLDRAEHQALARDSPLRARSSGAPASRRATRSESGATVQAASASRRTPPLTQSSRGPAATRSSPSAAATRGRRRMRPASGVRRAAPGRPPGAADRARRAVGGPGAEHRPGRQTAGHRDVAADAATRGARRAARHRRAARPAPPRRRRARRPARRPRHR